MCSCIVKRERLEMDCDKVSNNDTVMFVDMRHDVKYDVIMTWYQTTFNVNNIVKTALEMHE